MKAVAFKAFKSVLITCTPQLVTAKKQWLPSQLIP